MTPLLILSLLVTGEIYTWTDKEGVEHFTDDPNTIPKDARRRTTTGSELGRVETGSAPAPAANPQAIPVAPPVVIVQQAAPVPDPEEKWRRLFREARERIANLEDEIESDRKKVEEVNGMPVNARFTCTQFGAPPLYVAPTTSTGGTVTVGGPVAPGVTVSATGTTSTTYAPYPVVVAPCSFGFNPEYERVRERLDKNRRELVRAKEALQDLDRRASFEAVPQHWRR